MVKVWGGVGREDEGEKTPQLKTKIGLGWVGKKCCVKPGGGGGGGGVLREDRG